MAVSHRFAVSGKSLADAQAAEPKGGGNSLKGIQTWKDLCRESVILERNWSGRGFVVQGGYTCFEDEIQEFHIDEQHGLLLSLTVHGLFTVRTLDGTQLLWSLPGVVQFAQSGDSLLLWRGEDTTGAMQVWRFTDELPTVLAPVVRPSQLAATEEQLEEFQASTRSSVNTHCGYIPHANIPIPPGGWRTFALHEPYLALIDRDHPHLVQVYDILRGELHQTIDLGPIISKPLAEYGHPYVLFSVLLDLQISAKYLCACYAFAVIVVRLRVAGVAEENDVVFRADTSGVQRNAVLYEDIVHRHQIGGALPHLVAKVSSVCESPTSRVDDGELAKQHSNVCLALSAGADILEEYSVVERTAEEIDEVLRANATGIQERPRHDHCYISAHFSPDGRHLVVGSTFNQMYFFPDIDRMFDAGIAPAEIIQKMVVEEPIRFLKWEARDRVFAFRDRTPLGSWICVRHTTQTETMIPNRRCPS
ncbi:hypothetical protein BC835DRAFT_461783 [Cytidiella melzeri]|nr:hypothetical protein BC835DRAFT_461783 [Cytidiella melzeri]